MCYFAEITFKGWEDWSPARYTWRLSNYRSQLIPCNLLLLNGCLHSRHTGFWMLRIWFLPFAPLQGAMHFLTCLGIVLSFLGGVSCSCPSQCTCDDHGRNDGTGSRYAPLLATKCSSDSEKKDHNQTALFWKQIFSQKSEERRFSICKLKLSWVYAGCRLCCFHLEQFSS